MLILAAIQAIFALAFLLLGLVALFGIGLTGLLFLVPGAVFALIAGITQEQSRGATAIALAADAVLAWMAAHKLAALLPLQGNADLPHRLGAPGLVDFLVPGAVLLLVTVGAIAVIADWRALRQAKWY